MKKALKNNKTKNTGSSASVAVLTASAETVDPPIIGAAAEASPEGDDLAQAFARVETEVRAVDKSALLRRSLDMPSVVTTIIGAWPEIVALTAQISPLGGLDVARFKKLRDYALALAHTHAQYRAFVAPSDYTQLVVDLTRLRAIWTSDLRMLVQRGVLDAGHLRRMRTVKGHKGLAFDVASFVELFRAHWTTLEGQTSVRKTELDQASQWVRELITALGAREQSEPNSSAAGLLRAQAFTLCVQAYDEVRRAISFVRWHEGDVESIAPSLWAGRSRRHLDSDGEEDAPEAPAPTAVTPAPTAVTPAAPANTNAGATGATNSNAASPVNTQGAGTAA